MASFSLGSYSQIILDGSFFINRIPDEILRQMDEDSLYLSPTFVAECSAYKPHMTPAQRAVFDYNREQLKPKLSRNKKLDYAEDLWNSLCVITKTGRSRVLLITSNLLLIQKVVLRQLRVDVYNLHELTFMPSSSFNSLKKQYQCKMDRQRRLKDLTDRDEIDWLRDDTLDVYDEKGWMRLLWKASKVENGLEAVMYIDRDSPESLIKVFNWAHRTNDKLIHAQRLLELNREMLQCDWAAFPQMMIYRDVDQERPLGFYMKRFEGCQVLENEVRQENRNPLRFSTILRWCRMLASQIAYLGVFGIYVTDFTEQNFLLPAEGSAEEHMIMLDTDSFCLGEYYGARYKSEWDGWKILGLSGKRNVFVSNKADAIDLSLKLLYAEMFSILTAGQKPVVSERFVKDDPEINALFAKDGFLRYVFPGRLWSMMEDIFTRSNTDIRVPSVDLLLYELNWLEKNAPDGALELTYAELTEYYEQGRVWEPNGLGTVSPRQVEPELEKDRWRVEEPQPQPEYQPQPQPQPEYRQPWREIRKVNKKDHFTHSRLMGAFLDGDSPVTVPLEQQPKPLLFRPVRRKAANAWKEEQKQDQKRANQIGGWLVPLLLILLIAFTVWFCFFAQIDMIFEIRQMIMDFFSSFVEWWSETVMPMLRRLWQENIAWRFTQ